MDKLLKLIEKSTSQYHTVEAVKEELRKDGFQELCYKEQWTLEKGGKYMMDKYGATVFAFTVGEEFEAADGFRVAAAHGDFPGFRVKPNPEMTTEGYVQLNVETYGGVNLASWMDRGLSLAGKVVLKSDDVFKPEVRLVDFQKPLLTIPNIGIHLNREMNQGVELNKQIHMLPLVGMAEGTDGKSYFREYLANHLGVAVEEILDYDLQVYNAEQGQILGFNGEFVSAPRLDNLCSVHALVEGLAASNRKRGLNVIAIFDHEEIGSRSKQGANSVVLPNLLEKIYVSLGYTEYDCKNAVTESLMMSVDVSHAFHPSHADKYDPTNRNILNKGFSIKQACSQSYATDSEAIGIVQQICDKEGISYQKFLNRSDVAGGGTLGAIASAGLPVKTVDMGVPLLAMHSSRELMGAKDQKSMEAFMKAYFRL